MSKCVYVLYSDKKNKQKPQSLYDRFSNLGADIKSILSFMYHPGTTMYF